MRKNISLPFDLQKAEQIAQEFGTPVYVYDRVGICNTAKKLNNTFAWANGYKNYFAVKATPTPAILKALHEQGMGFDCSSRTELLMMQKMGISGDDIFYTSNNTPKEDFELAIELDAIINIDDLTQVDAFLEVLGNKAYQNVAVRYNPGDLKSGNDIIGEPVQAKYGMSSSQIIKAFQQLKGANIKNFGLHAMVASNERNPEYFAETARLLLQLKSQVEEQVGIHISFVNLGGGFGVNYQPYESPLDVSEVSRLLKDVFSDCEGLRVFTENGRYVTGPHGYLLSRVQYVMDKYKTYVGIDASMHNLMRPGMYGAYHHITVLGKENQKPTQTYDIVGSLCENNDKFAIDRKLPKVEPGDLLVIHDAGAHGHAMGFNYNGLLRSAEVFLNQDGTNRLIRRAETPEDYFRSIVWH
jgi:diaminopimelate decarboxylase